MSYSWAGGPLAVAVMRGDLAELGSLLARGVDPNERHTQDGTTAAHRAAQNLNDEALAMLTSHGADFNLTTTATSFDGNDRSWPSGMTPRDMLDRHLRSHIADGWFDSDHALWERLATITKRELEAWCQAAVATPPSVEGQWRATLAPGYAASEAEPLKLELFADGSLALAYTDEAVPSRGMWTYDGQALIFELLHRDDDGDPTKTSLVEADVRGGAIEFEHDGRWVFVRASRE